MRILLFFLLLSFSINAIGQVHKDFINSAELIKPNGYSHAIVVSGTGKTIYISGEVPFNAKGELIGKGDFKMQVEQVFANITTALKSCGASFDDVIKMTTFVANYSPDYLKILREVRANFISAKNPPTNTTVGVQTLSPDVLIEIEAVAVIKE